MLLGPGGEIHDARSITGTCILLNGAAVSWQSKRQQTTALSSTEAEYMAITETAKTVSFVFAVSVMAIVYSASVDDKAVV